jgi:tetratricopeptide (TPR) repeat protein
VADRNFSSRDEASAPQNNSNTIFVGRVRETAELFGSLSKALAGHGSLFTINGEPGIGKTRLASRLSDFAHSQRVKVCWGRCWENGDAPAYWPWIQALRECLGTRDERVTPDLGRLLTGWTQRTPPATPESLTTGGSSEAGSEQFRLFDSVSQFFREESRKTPLVLILDDIHAADPESLLLLRFIARDLHDLRMMVVATYRTAETTKDERTFQLIGEINREGRNLALGGLSEDDAREFLRLRTGQHSAAELAPRLHGATEGNPFFLGEILELLIAERKFNRIGLENLKTPASVNAAIRRRLDLATPNTREILRLASVVGKEFSFEAIARISGLGEKELLEELHTAVDSALVAPSSQSLGRYIFSHALIAQTLYDEHLKSQLPHLHHRVAQILEDLYQENREAHAAELAHHYVLASSAAPPEKAVGYCRLGAVRAESVYAYEEASRLRCLALKVLRTQRPIDKDAQYEALVALGHSSYNAGLFDQSRNAFAEAAAIARECGKIEDRARAVLGLAMLPSDMGTVDLGLLEQLEEVLNSLGNRDSSLRAMIMVRLARELQWSSQTDRSKSLAIAATEIASRSSDDETLLYVLYSSHYTLWDLDALNQRVARADEIVRLAQKSGNRLWQLRSRYMRLANLFELGDLGRVDEEIEQYALLSRGLGFGYTQLATAARALMSGRFQEGERLAHEALEIGYRLERRARRHRMNFRTFMFQLDRERGRESNAEPFFKVAADRYPDLTLGRCLLALCYAETGQLAQARAEFGHLAAGRFNSLRRDSTWIASISVLAEICRILNDREAGSILYDLLLPYAGRNAIIEIPVCFGPVRRYLGILATLLGRSDEAQEHFRLALEHSQRIGARAWTANIQHEYGVALLESGRPGDRERARDLDESAFEIARALGMKSLEEKSAALRQRLDTSKTGETTWAIEATPPSSPNIFRREGDYWSIGFEGRSVFRVRDSKGMAYVAQLLASPGAEMHVLDLTGPGEGADPESSTIVSMSAERLEREGLSLSRDRDAGEMLDAQARSQYRARLIELRSELEHAKSIDEFDRAEKIEEEIEMLTSEISRAVGLGGRLRRAASGTERARLNVTRAIKAAIDRISEHDAALALFLSTTIHTGTYCVWAPNPENSVTWLL